MPAQQNESYVIRPRNEIGSREERARYAPEAKVAFDELPDVITVDELAAFMRIGRSTAYRLASERRLCVRAGRRILIPKSRLENYLEGRKA
jgi:excisionase family DNA binding protein